MGDCTVNNKIGQGVTSYSQATHDWLIHNG